MGAHGCVLCKTCLRCTICGGCEHVVDAGWGVPESNSERKAWARLVKAAAGDADSLAAVSQDASLANLREHGQRNVEYWDAVQALRDLGVPVDALLEGS